MTEFVDDDEDAYRYDEGDDFGQKVHVSLNGRWVRRPARSQSAR
jgi:hypothetical protein